MKLSHWKMIMTLVGILIINALPLLQAEEMITVAVLLFAFAVVTNELLLWMDYQLHRPCKTFT